MPIWLSDQAQLLAIVGLCGILWSAETIVPLVGRGHRGLRHAVPNLGLALLLVATNVTLSWGWARIAATAAAYGAGLFPIFPVPSWIQGIVGVAALDLFGYLAHVSLHRSWVGWQIHRVHHSDVEVDVTTAFRQHPAETVWRMLWQLAAVLLLAIPLWVVVAYLSLAAFNAQFEHANIRVNGNVDRLLRLLFVTPDMHKIHHPEPPGRPTRTTQTSSRSGIGRFAPTLPGDRALRSTTGSKGVTIHAARVWARCCGCRSRAGDSVCLVRCAFEALAVADGVDIASSS